MGDTLSLLIAVVAAFLPVLLWAYAFSYIEAEPLSAKRFAVGILSGSIAVIPVAFMKEILSALSLSSQNTFVLLSHGAAPFSNWIALLLLLFVIITLVFVVMFAIRGSSDGSVSSFFRSATAIIGASLFFPIFAFLFAGQSDSNVTVTIASANLSGFVAITLAYFVVAIAEECGKHLSIFSLGTPKDIAGNALKFAIFVALGFAFFENILYFSTAFASGGGASIWFSRSIFSVGVHVVSAVMLAVPLLAVNNWGMSPKYTTLLSAFLLGIFFHAFFDIGLTFGKTWVVLVYLAFGYFYLTKVFFWKNA